MKCKYCRAELKNGDQKCPECGKEVRRSSVWKAVIAGVCCLALLLGLTWLILDGMGIKIGPRENSIHYKNSYTVSDSKALRDAKKVIATVNGAELTNGEFQLHYWVQVVNYLQNMPSYGSYGFDQTKPLDEQKVSADSDTTWQQYFIVVALESWHRYQLLNMLAEEEGIKLSASEIKRFADMPAQLETTAKNEGFASADEMFETDFGKGCTAQDYVNFVRMSDIALLYTAEKEKTLSPTTAELEAYYEENKEAFEEGGILKGGAQLVDARHILVQLDNVAVNSDYTVTYTDEQWAACLQEAEKILNEWKNGENPSEASFGELAVKYSKDEDNAASGGLLAQMYEGEMVSTFNDWCFDKNRVPGDTGIVKTKFGYHIIYYIQTAEEWSVIAEENVLADKLSAIIEESKERWPMEVNYKKIVLADPSILN